MIRPCAAPVPASRRSGRRDHRRRARSRRSPRAVINGIGLAKQACTHVDRSITLLHRADRPPDSSSASSLNHKAYIELLAALPIAAAGRLP